MPKPAWRVHEQDASVGQKMQDEPVHYNEWDQEQRCLSKIMKLKQQPNVKRNHNIDKIITKFKISCILLYK